MQYAGTAALDEDLTPHIQAYRRKRDMVVAALSDGYELPFPEGAFYAFPRAPWGTATDFVAEAIRRNLLIIPGNVFSLRDTHFRISYAVDDTTLKRGSTSSDSLPTTEKTNEPGEEPRCCVYFARLHSI